MRFPAVPHAGADGADIDHGQDQQQAQPFRAGNGFSKIQDGLEIGKVTLEGGAAHQQVMFHQPGHGFGLFLAQPQPRAQAPRDIGAQQAVIAAAPLGDIVQQHRNMQNAPVDQLVDDGARQAVIGFQLTALDPGQQADGADRVFVHRVMVVHVILHLRHDTAEIRNKAPEDTGLVHPPEHGFRITRRSEHLKEQRIGGLVAPHAFVDQLRIAGGGTHGERVDGQPLAVGQREDLQQVHRISLEEFIIGHADLAAPQGEALQPGRPAGERGQPGEAGGRFIEVGEEQARQVAHRFRHQEIMAHEPLHRAHAVTIGIGQAGGKLALHVEGEAFLGAAGDVVQHDAHRPQEAFGAAELAQFVRGEQALVHQFGNAVHLVQIFADPEQGVQIAQAALAFLQIGFDDIAAVAHALVTGFTLGQLFGHEGAGGAGHHFLAEPGIGFVEQRLITPDEAGFQKGGAHRHVGTSDADHVV